MNQCEKSNDIVTSPRLVRPFRMLGLRFKKWTTRNEQNILGIGCFAQTAYEKQVFDTAVWSVFGSLTNLFLKNWISYIFYLNVNLYVSPQK